METSLTKRDEAYQIHSRIITNGKIVQSALIDMCKDLKRMRDEGLYLELGYETFEDYSENACGIKQRQAYSYISAYEKLGENYLAENSQLGITKLELISQISSYEREEFLSENDVESLSTRELKQQVEKFKSQTEQLTLDLDNAKKDNEQAQSEIEELRQALEQNQPADVIVGTIEPDQSVIDEAVKQAREADAETIKKLKAQIKEQKDKVKQVTDSKDAEVKKAKKEATDAANSKIDKLIKEKEAVDEKLQEALRSAKAANADEDVTAIRFLFTNLQSTANEIKKHLNKVAQKDQQQAENLSAVMAQALNSIIEKL